MRIHVTAQLWRRLHGGPAEWIAVRARVMAANDPVAALAACRQHTARDAQGRRYCAMSVWLDPTWAPQTGN